MFDLKWSSREKKIARRAYETALDLALAKALAEFKAKAAAVQTPSEMWDIEDLLRDRRRHIDDMFDYRYSVLPLVFARLVREGLLDIERLAGLSEEKLEIIHGFLAR